MGKKSRRSGGGGGKRAAVRNAPPSQPNRPPDMPDLDQLMSGIFAGMFGGAGGQDGCAETGWRGLPARDLFLAAAREKDVARVRELLSDPATRRRANDVDGDGCTVLHNLAFSTASEDGAEVVRLLAAAGCDVDARSAQTRETALQIATIYGRVETVRALVECGARVDLADWRGKAPLGTAREKCGHGGGGEGDCCRTLRIVEGAAERLKRDTSRADGAEDLRAKGNDAFKAGEYHKARDLYTQSIDALEDHRAYSNRALCCIKIGREILGAHGELEELPDGTYRTLYPDAVRRWGGEAASDAGKAAEMCEFSEKARHRQVLGFAMMRDFPRARKHCKNALEKFPESDVLNEAMRFFDRLHIPDHISNPFSDKHRDADRLVDEGCDACQCSYCFKTQPYVEEDPFCSNCSCDMSLYEPGKFSPLIISFIMGKDLSDVCTCK